MLTDAKLQEIMIQHNVLMADNTIWHTYLKLSSKYLPFHHFLHNQLSIVTKCSSMIPTVLQCVAMLLGQNDPVSI